MRIRSILFLAALASATAIAILPSTTHGAKATTVHGVKWLDRFEDAVAQAQQAGKPILFLSMFGRLDEDMPCANARTLRATLFKDPEFKKLVTDEVIPAWEMVREVPKVTIDFGEGRYVVRTVRGNAVLYLCNSDGRVIDAFPGIYTSEDFFPMVRESIRELANSSLEEVAAFHKERRKPIPRSASTGNKAMVESPTLYLMGALPSQAVKVDAFDEDQDRMRFLKAASVLSDLSLQPMTAEAVARRVTGRGIKELSPEEISQRILKADSRNNVVIVRPVVHFWLASEKALLTPAQARDTVLETILKIPYKDPYFGLKDVLMPGTPG